MYKKKRTKKQHHQQQTPKQTTIDADNYMIKTNAKA